MTQNEKQRQEDQSTTRDSAPAKKPYTKPEFRYERVFETMALACGKTAGVGFCKGHNKSS
jgi:hypothetical protein